MTAIWGPMGWVTLHSISLLYPDNPTQNDKQILLKFLQDFAESITCPHCEKHFKTMFENYRKTHPEWSNSRFDLFLFIVRAHNTVNKRLDKPIQQTLEDCIKTLQNTTKSTSPAQYRIAYLNYLMSNWAPQQSGDGFIALSNIPTPEGVYRLTSPNSPEEYARDLYSSLRLADLKGIHKVVAITPEGDGLSTAISDRLIRAANS